MNSEEENDSEILRKLSPTLFERKQSVDDSAPEGYFESFPDEMMKRIKTDSDSELKKSTHPYFNIRNVAIAAGIAVILASIPYFKTILESDSNAVATSQRNSATIENSESSEVLATYFDDSELYAELSVGYESIEIPLPETDSETLIDYLVDEDVSNQLIIESLNTDNF